MKERGLLITRGKARSLFIRRSESNFIAKARRGNMSVSFRRARCPLDALIQALPIYHLMFYASGVALDSFFRYYLTSEAVLTPNKSIPPWPRCNGKYEKRLTRLLATVSASVPAIALVSLSNKGNAEICSIAGAQRAINVSPATTSAAARNRCNCDRMASPLSRVRVSARPICQRRTRYPASRRRW